MGSLVDYQLAQLILQNTEIRKSKLINYVNNDVPIPKGPKFVFPVPEHILERKIVLMAEVLSSF